MICFAFIYAITPKSCNQLVTSLSDALERNLCPVSQLPSPAISASSLPLSPRPELDEVQKGTTVLPVKSFAVIKPLTGQAAMPHQMG